MVRRTCWGRPFWVLWSSLTATSLGDGIRLVALPLIATQITPNPTLIALVTVFTYLPALLFGQIAGVFVNRVRKRRLISLSQVGRAVVLTFVAVAVTLGILDITMLCAAAFLCGLGETVFDSASHAILPRLVPEHALGRANSHLQSRQIIGEMFVGRALGGILFSVAQPLPILANVLLLAAAALAMLKLGQREAVPDPLKPTGAGARIGRFVEDLAEGIRVVTHSRLLGIMLALSAVGSLVGARFAVRVIRKLGARGTAVISVLVSGASIVALAWTPELGLASPLLAFNGAAVTVWNVMTITIRQATVEPRMLGRVSSTYLVLPRTALPVGASLAGCWPLRPPPRPHFWYSADS